MLLVVMLLSPCLSFVAPLIRCAGRGPWAAIRESFALTTGHRARIFIKMLGVLIVVGLQLLLLMMLDKHLGQFMNYSLR